MRQQDERARRLGLVLKLGLAVVVLVAANQVGNWVAGELGFHMRPSNEPLVHRAIMISMAVYVVLMALPFVPGVEIGLGLMMMFGAPIVPLVYLATVVGLVLGFLIGRIVPQRTIIDLASLLRLKRLRDTLLRLEPLGSDERLAFLLQNADSRWVPFLLRYRFAAVMVLLNIPGNALIGGGGGISCIAGFSRLFTLPAYTLTAALAVLPFPLLVLLSSR